MKILVANLFTLPDMQHIKISTDPEDVNTAFDEAYQYRSELQKSIFVRHIKQNEKGEIKIETETFDIRYD